MNAIKAQIRLAEVGELPLLKALIEKSVRQLSVDYYTPRQIESALIFIFGVDTQLIADGTYFVAEADGRIVGCGGWSKRRTLFGGDQMKTDEDSLLDPASEAARIRAFFVDPDYARQGIGKQIIEVCEGAARAAGFRRCELGATLPGEPLYRAVGYRAIERIEHLMPDGEALPIIRMERTLVQR